MDIRQLRYFCAIAEEGQISRAAKRLHIAQPPLSHQLKTLEDELGVKLIERSTRHMAVTPAGRLFYQRAVQILGLIQTAADDARDQGLGVIGTLAVGSPPALGGIYFPPRLREFHRLYPQVRFCWREGNTYRVLELLDRDLVEVAMVRLPVPMGDYESRPLLTEPWVVVAASGDAQWSKRENLSLSELADVPLILMHRQEGLICHDMVVNEMMARQIPVNIICESDNISAILSLVDQRLGLAVLPASTLSVRPAQDFHQIAVSDCQLHSSVALIWKKSRRLSRAATLFIEMFEQSQ